MSREKLVYSNHFDFFLILYIINYMNYSKIESEEDYLEMILMVQEVKGSVKSIDVARGLGFSKPSVSVAMKKLKDLNYINIDQKGYIHLTNEGLELANKVYERHKTLTKIFESLGVNPETSEEVACKIEHDLTDDVYIALKNHFNL